MVERLCRLEIRVDIQTNEESYSDEFGEIREAREYIEDVLKEVECEDFRKLEIRVDIQTNYNSYSDEFDDIREADEYIDNILRNVEY